MKMIKTAFIASALAALATMGAPAISQTAMNGKASGDIDSESSDAEVRKIDKVQGKITLKHGPIKSLDMPGMTMVFSVKEKVLLDTVKPGDKVKFRAIDENGKLTVVEMVLTK